MTFDDAWKPFHDVSARPLEHAAQWKREHGGTLIGHLLPDVPEEILHAATAVPVAIEGASVLPSRAQAHIPSYTCNHAMGALELGLMGGMDMLDGMIIPYVCDTTRNLYHVWNRVLPAVPADFLRMPKRLDYPGVRDYLIAEFSRLFDSVCAMTGAKRDEHALHQSIRLYNESRRRLRDAYDMHRKGCPSWTGDRIRALIASAVRSDRQTHLQWMESLPWGETAGGAAADGILLYVRGKVWDPGELPGLLDELGFRVVKDEMVTGFRAIDQDAASDEEPITALVNRHCAQVPYAGYHCEPHRIVTDFVARVQESNARGVLFVNPKFCEAAAFDTPDMRQALDQAGIPSMALETSARGVSPAQLRLRLEAFSEMLSGDLP